MVWALVPIKPQGQVKSRLASQLSKRLLARLFQSMLEDVLQALKACPQVDRVMLLSSRHRAGKIAEAWQVELLEDTSGDGLNADLTRSVAWLMKQGAKTLLILPGDLPLITAQDIAAMIAGHRSPGLTLTPDSAHQGTNGMLISPLDLIPFCYGENSLNRHTEAARAAGIEPRIVGNQNIGLDIDEPVDLARLRQMTGESKSQELLAEINQQGSIEL